MESFLNPPLIVFSDHSTSLFSWLIKVRTKGTYNHVMILNGEKTVATQNNVYKEIPLQHYMVEKSRLLFVRIHMNRAAEKAVMTSVSEKLALPWYKKLYDLYGIVGQATGLRWFNKRSLEFCSEDVVSRYLAGYKHFGEDLKAMFDEMDRHEDPEHLKDYLLHKKFKKHVSIEGTWDYENGFRP